MAQYLLTSLVSLADVLPAESPVTEATPAGRLILLLTVFALAAIGFVLHTELQRQILCPACLLYCKNCTAPPVLRPRRFLV